MSIADLRKEYTLAGLRKKDLDRDPIRQFRQWLQQAMEVVPEPNAMILATASKPGRPHT